jgi:hypothetical protein
MLDHKVLRAVDDGLFHIYTGEQVMDGMELLTGVASGMVNTVITAAGYPHESVLGRAQKTLQSYRRACQQVDHPKHPRKSAH